MITYGSTTLTSYNSIVKTEVYYYKSTSATSLSGGSWATTKPTWENGKYIWQKIRTVYEDGTHTESDPVNITGQQGATGTAAYSFKLNSSDSIIGKTKDGEYTIKKITFSATYKQGTGAVSAYNGRFKIESTTNGSTWKTEYTSSGNESSKAFTIPNDIIAIKCSLYQSGGTTVLLDIVTVPVVKDGVDAIGLRDSIPYYLASDKDTGITRLTQGWTRYRPQLTAEKKYLWVYYVSRYSEGSTEPELIEIKDDLVHFVNNGDESPVESCVVDIDPVQDLNGYDSPWPAGGGKNLLPPLASETKNNVSISVADDGTITINGTASADTYFDKNISISIDAGTTYYLCGFNISASSSSKLTIFMITSIGNPQINLHTANAIFSAQASDDTVVRQYRLRVPEGVTYTNFIVKPMLQIGGSTPTSYTPYSNICPITGWTGAKVTRCGVNIFDKSEVIDGAYINDTDGTEKQSAESKATGWIPVVPGEKYYILTEQTMGAWGAWYDKNKAFIKSITGYLPSGGQKEQTAPSNASYMRLTCFRSGSGNIDTFAVNHPSTDHDYHPYQSKQVIIPFGQTVYGGTLDVTKGELVVDRAMVELPSDMSWATWGVNYRTSGITGFFIYRHNIPSTLDFSNIGIAVLTNLLAINNGVWGGSKVGYWTNASGASSNWYEIVSISNETASILSTDTSAEAVAKFKAFLASTPLNVLYELATPTTYHLTPQEITILCKENNIFADTGQTAISYYDNQTSTDPYVDYSLTSAFDASTIEPAYIETEWVESTGKQYVYLDWKPPIKTWGFEIDFISYNALGTTAGAWNEDTNKNGYGTIFGVRNASGVNNAQLSSYSNGLLRIGNGTNQATEFKTNHTRQQIKLQNTTITKTDGTTSTVSRLDETASKPYCNMTVFGLHEGLRRAGNGGISEPSSTRIYSLKFYNGDTLTVDLVGAIRKRDSVTGLYDKVSKHFYPAPGMLFGDVVGDIGDSISMKEAMDKANPQTIVVNKDRTRMWEATVPFNDLQDGQKITVTYSYGNVVSSIETDELIGWDDTSSNQQVYLKLTFADGHKTDWIPCYYSNTSRLTTHYGAGIPIQLTYRENILANASETASGNMVLRGFYADANYDTNNTDIVRWSYGRVIAGSNKIFPYSIIMQNADERWESIVTSSTTAKTKTRNTHGFRLDTILYQAANTTTNENAENTSWQLRTGDPLMDMRYNLNIEDTNELRLVHGKSVYLVGTVGTDGLFYLADQWWSQSLPTTEDGKIYIFLGQVYDWYRCGLATMHPIYKFVDGKLKSTLQIAVDALDKAKEVAQDLADLGADLQAQIDGKIETWCQKTDPSTAWTTTELKNQHNGDLWYYTGESTSSYKNNTTYKYTASTNKWTAYSASTDLFDKIDAKASIYYGKPSAVTQNLEVGDYLVDSTDGCSYRWDGSKWVKLTDYNAAIDAIEIGGRNLLCNSNQSLTTVSSKGDFYLSETIPTDTTIVVSVQIDADDITWASSGNRRMGFEMSQVTDGVASGTQYAGVWWGYPKTAFHGRVWNKVKLTRDFPATIKRYGIYVQGVTGGTYKVSKPKVEIATKPTDWTPAPEDTEAEISALQEDLQSQIDEKIQTYYQSTNPASAWTTADIRATHDGDLWCYTGTTTSTYTKDNVYRYNASNNTWTTYSASGDLFDKVDGKTTVFYGKTTDTFTDVETGDYLVDATDGSSYRYDGSQWVKVTDYQAAIDKIEVGGRNYKRNSNFRDQLNKWSIWAGATVTIDENIENKNWAHVTMGTDKTYGGFSWELGKKATADPMQIASGDEITISFDAQLIEGEGNAVVWLHYRSTESGTNLSQATQRFPLTEAITRFSHTFTVPTHSTYTVDTINVMIGIMDGTIKQGRFTNIKVEKGNRSTDWTPAPEDIDASISTAQTTADEALAATQPISSKTFTGVIGTANDIANASLYFAKVHPTTYTDPWMVKMKIKASVPTGTNFRKTIDISIHGCRSNFISYDSMVANYNSNPIYYINLYRATQEGIETNHKGHALGFGLRSSVTPTDPEKARTFEVDLLEVDGCTVDWIDPPVKYADMDGTGSTNYVGCTELGITSNGQNATNNGNTYDRIKYSTIKAAEAIARYNIIVGTSAGYKHLKSGTPWDITYPILYADAALNANATGSSNYLTIPFTVTTTQNMTLTPYKPVYIEGTLDGTTFTPIDTTPLTQTVPTSDNGHQYILLGSAYSTTAINLEAEHPIYQFQNGNFVTIAEAASRIGANAENLIKATYAVCSTAAGTNAKTADCMNFELYEGARIQVTFTNANTASAPTLDINNTGAKAIYINKTITSDTNLLLWTAGSKMEFVYDGTGWIAQNVPYALYGTCSTGASTAAKAVTCNEAVICKGTTISVNMTNTNTAADATMNVGSTVAKDIYANGAKLTTNSRFNWRANTTQKFVFDGQVWRMDDDSVKALATAYITEIDDDGIMVHPEDDSTSGWAISDAIQLFKNGVSYIKLWIENNIPKIRIGKEYQGHIILDNDSVDIKDDNKVLASFGATSVIGDKNNWHQTIAANQITFAKGDDIITYISPDKLYTINAEVADAFYISNYSIRNASDGKLVIGLRR